MEQEESKEKDTIDIETLKNIEGLRADLKYKDMFIEKRFKNYQISSKSFRNIDVNDIGLMEHQLEKFKKMLLCSVCSTREKKVIL